MLIIAWAEKIATSPVPAMPDEGIALARQPRQRAQADRGVEHDDERHQQEAVFLGGHGDDEIGMRIGQLPFHLPLAHAHAEQPALLDGRGGDSPAASGHRPRRPEIRRCAGRNVRNAL
jgi:hypothetical protein